MSKMKDYLNREQKNQLLTLLAVMQQLDGIRTISGTKNKPLWEDWKERNFLTTEESRCIKTAYTNIKKFTDNILDRLNKQEQETIQKQLMKFDFRITDDFTMQKIYRDISDRMKNAAVPREQFDDWSCEIMEIRCKNCDKHWEGCDLHKVFSDNFIPDGGFNRDNCIYSYEG